MLLVQCSNSSSIAYQQQSDSSDSRAIGITLILLLMTLLPLLLNWNHSTTTIIQLQRFQSDSSRAIPRQEILEESNRSSVIVQQQNRVVVELSKSSIPMLLAVIPLPRPDIMPPVTTTYCSTSPYVSIRQHTSAYVSIRQHTSAYVSIRQHASAYVSIRQHTSAYVSKARHNAARYHYILRTVFLFCELSAVPLIQGLIGAYIEA